MATMDIGRLGNEDVVFKRKFRWIFTIADDYASNDPRIGNLGNVIVRGGDTTKKGYICKISARPNLNFNEQEVQHVIETVYLPAKATWQAIDITVYDVARKASGILTSNDDYLYKWIKTFYNPEVGKVNPVAEPELVTGTDSFGFPKKTAVLELYDGHGVSIERWTLQGCWPVSVNWGELDYESSDYITVNFSLRYDRAIMQNTL